MELFFQLRVVSILFHLMNQLNTPKALALKESLLKELGIEQRLISMKNENIESAFAKIKLLSKTASLTESKKMIDFSDDNYKKCIQK